MKFLKIFSKKVFGNLFHSSIVICLSSSIFFAGLSLTLFIKSASNVSNGYSFSVEVNVFGIKLSSNISTNKFFIFFYVCEKTPACSNKIFIFFILKFQNKLYNIPMLSHKRILSFSFYLKSSFFNS